jgi:PilZ domain
MSKHGEKRKNVRVQFADPIEGTLSNVRVRIVDISTTGVRVEHDAPLVHGKRLVLNFPCEGEILSVAGEVVRCRLDHSAAHIGTRKVAYTSGLRFVDLNDDACDALWDLVIGQSITNLYSDREDVVGVSPTEFAIVS